MTQELGLELSVNHMIVGLQTEEAPVAIQLNGTKNTVIWGALLAFWNATAVSTSQVSLLEPHLFKITQLLMILLDRGQVVAFRPNPAASGGGVDLSYRLYGLGVPVSASEKALLVDKGRYELPAAGKGFSMALAVLN